MAALCEQIASLESENVGPEDWVVMGEAGAWSWLQAKVRVEPLMPLLGKCQRKAMPTNSLSVPIDLYLWLQKPEQVSETLRV
jgi:hypothetical protein